ncbi:MAG: shikimate kinase [Myxococcaceae bacterium]
MHSLLELVDPRLRAELAVDFGRRQLEGLEGLPRGVTVVLAGQRAAGKSTLLPKVAALLSRDGVDLDAELERRAGRPIREWFTADEAGFRAAEREAFRSLPPGCVVAVGGGFLSNHADLLRPHLVVEVPVSFDTYCERLKADPTRPRLRPELSLMEELREVFTERERRHAAARPMRFTEFLARAERPARARRVVTLPPHDPLETFAWAARHVGADLLEVRTDLHPPELDLTGAARALPLMISERVRPAPPAWRALATVIDSPQGGGSLVSLHTDRALTTAEAMAKWRSLASPGVLVKHVEPLGEPGAFPRLLETQRQLIERFGAGRVTVLATGPLALPFRAVLNQHNGLDYLALSSRWRAAEGQRLLSDAVREARRSVRDGSTERLGILGGALDHSRSPRIHAQPFDRIELPIDTDVPALLAALRPHYRGFAVTNPFKKRLGVPGVAAANTLVRTASGWRASNTDVEGARVTWEALGRPSSLTVLGEGGVAPALRELPGVEVRFVTRAQITAAPIGGVVVWTWPVGVDVPHALNFAGGARVAIIAYGAAARVLAQLIEERGGVPVRLGARWFIAQARGQRAAWALGE